MPDFKLMNDVCVVQRLAVAGEATSRILYVPWSKEDKGVLPAFGRIVAQGPGRKAEDGTRVPNLSSIGINAGDVVMYLPRYAVGSAARLGFDDDHAMILDYDILAKVEDAEFDDRGNIERGEFFPSYGYTVLEPKSNEVAMTAGGIRLLTTTREKNGQRMAVGVVFRSQVSLREEIGTTGSGPRKTLALHGTQGPQFVKGQRVLYERFGVWYAKFSGTRETYAIINTTRVAAEIENEAVVECL